MNLLITLLAFVVALGLLIVVHEFGHYLVARLCNVKVLRFSVGFGAPLWRRTFGRDGTEWVIAAFPLGGYVKMADEREGRVAAEDLPRAFNRQSVYRRFAIVVAGPVANFLLAILFYWMLFLHGVPGLKPVLGPIAPNTPAASAGFRSGETIVKIGEEAVPTWQDARWVLLQHAVRKAQVRIEVRDESGAVAWRVLDLAALTGEQLDSDFMRAAGFSYYRPAIRPVIGEVINGGAAERSGLKPGDEFIAIDGEEITRWDQVVERVRSRPGRSLKVEIERDGKVLPEIVLTPGTVVEAGREVGKIGAAPRVDPGMMTGLTTEVRFGVVEGLGRALHKTWDTSLFTLKMLGKMIVGEVSLKNLSGPITIADYAGQTAQSGWVAYLLFLALISISLGVLNLLPIPLLDGGHLMYYMVEIIKGSPVSERAIEIGQHVGVALLFTLMAFALYNDINRLISG
ncbi:MAG TPA: RIP metalloprotease RseP [Burkholderiales bacterium]|nr:RIP metalloprotease RseP [Burkholderiales bacterium]